MTDASKLESGLPGFAEFLGMERARSAVMQNLQERKELLDTGSVRLQNGRTTQLQERRAG